MKLSFLTKVALGGLVAVALAGAAQGAVISRTFDIEASRFVQTFGSDTTHPLDPVHLNFTLTFDDSADIGTTTAGLTINAFDLPYSAEYQYFATTDALALATDLVGPASCSAAPGTFCVFIHDLTSAAPDLAFFQNALPTNNVWRAEVRSITFADALVPGGVPEPAAWALMLTGFGLGGARLRARRRRLA